METNTHHTAICLGPVAHLDRKRISEQPGVDLYEVDGTDVQDQIDLALLDHLHCWRTIVFVGGEQAKREAQAYGVAWIKDTPRVNDELAGFWRRTLPVCDSP